MKTIPARRSRRSMVRRVRHVIFSGRTLLGSRRLHRNVVRIRAMRRIIGRFQYDYYERRPVLYWAKWLIYCLLIIFHIYALPLALYYSGRTLLSIMVIKRHRRRQSHWHQVD